MDGRVEADGGVQPRHGVVNGRNGADQALVRRRPEVVHIVEILHRPLRRALYSLYLLHKRIRVFAGYFVHDEVRLAQRKRGQQQPRELHVWLLFF